MTVQPNLPKGDLYHIIRGYDAEGECVVRLKIPLHDECGELDLDEELMNRDDKLPGGVSVVRFSARMERHDDKESSFL
jgi:hypothetical protein